MRYAHRERSDTQIDPEREARIVAHTARVQADLERLGLNDERPPVGRPKGRPTLRIPPDLGQQIRELDAAGITRIEMSRRLGLSAMTLLRMLRNLGLATRPRCGRKRVAR